MLQYFDEMRRTAECYGLVPEEIIIVGSSAITVHGGRKNNDIEFSIKKESYRKIPFGSRVKLMFVDHEDLGENVDLFKDRYLCIGIRDEMLFQDKCFDKFECFKIVRPEIEYLYKIHKKRTKDLEDLEQIKNDSRLRSAFDWDYIEAMGKEHVPLRYAGYGRFRDASWRCMKKMERGIKRLSGR